MSNPTSFVNAYVGSITSLIEILEKLRTQNDMLVQDPTLVDRYFDPTSPSPPRSDIVAQDITNAESAIVQMLFAFDSGDPPQKSYLYKMLP